MRSRQTGQSTLHHFNQIIFNLVLKPSMFMDTYILIIKF